MKHLHFIIKILIIINAFSYARGENSGQQWVTKTKRIVSMIGTYHETATIGMRDTVALILQETDSARIAQLAVPVIIQELERLYQYHSGSVTAASTEAEGEYGGELLELLAETGDPRAVRILVTSMPSGWLAVRGLVRIGLPAIDPMLNTLETNSKYTIRAMAAFALGEIAQDHLLPQVETNQSYRNLLNDTIIPALKKALNDEEEFVREKAQESLTKISAR